MPDPLATVTQAARRKREAEQGYRDALHLAWVERLPVREIARAAGVTRQAVYKVLNRRDESMTRQTLTPVPGAESRYDDEGRELVEVMTCGHCGRSWNDAAVSSITPAPSGRCPFEHEHEYDD